MAPRANWKGFLRLSLVTCPVALYPATSDTEKVSFNQINRKTGHRIKYAKVDADTGEEVANEDIMKGYKVDTDTYIEVSKDELDELALESTRTIEIDEFVPRADIDSRYVIRPYYLVPDGKVGHDAFAVIRDQVRKLVAIEPETMLTANVQDDAAPAFSDMSRHHELAAEGARAVALHRTGVGGIRRGDRPAVRDAFSVAAVGFEVE
jgi:non-homologous end joining protein Ku